MGRTMDSIKMGHEICDEKDEMGRKRRSEQTEQTPLAEANSTSTLM